jgi:hypothetical protein
MSPIGPSRQAAFFGPVGRSLSFFRTISAAKKAGKAALKQLLIKLNT